MIIIKEIKKYYLSEWQYLKENIRYAYFPIGIFATGLVMAIIISILDPDATMKIVTNIALSFQEKGLYDVGPDILSLKIFLNNIEVAVLILFLSLIPFVPIGLLICFANGLIAGLVSAVFYTKTGDLILLFASLLPHGIIELPIIFYTATIGMIIWTKITLSIFNRGKDIKVSLKRVVQCLIMIIIPLLVSAALIESFITPLIIQK